MKKILTLQKTNEMADLELFNNFNSSEFEKLSIENGFTYWWASDLANLLGYKNLSSLTNAINKAVTVITNLNIDVFDNIVQEHREINGEKIKDYRLSRFACYLITMNADVKKQAVSEAQAYFATLAGAIHEYIKENEKLDRVRIRGKISEHEKSISSTFKEHKGENYAFFQNAGYRGMYNMNMKQLKALKGIDSKRSLLDFMGSTELAANLFRITQTEERIKNRNIKGQKELEETHEQVGRMVRKAMIEMSGTPPEKLPAKEDIKEVKKELKKKNRELKKIDKKKKK